VARVCDAATSTDGTSHLFKSPHISEECLPPLPAIYTVLCRLNPAFNSTDDLRYRSELQETHAGKPMLQTCLQEPSLKIFSVMGSVPDPEHTHLGLLTDRAIDAIQTAAAQAGYNPYSHFLPWASSDPQKNSEGSSVQGTEGDSHQPGLLIFRRDSPAPNYLAVFLIAELPTTGLDAIGRKA
jgi:hypothetical protein